MTWGFWTGSGYEHGRYELGFFISEHLRLEILKRSGEQGT